MFSQKNALQLEPLEPRRLLSTILETADADGDRYEIRIAGPGTVASVDLTGIELTGTTAASRVMLSVVDPAGNGQVDLPSLSTAGNPLGLLRIQGDLGGLNSSRLNQLDVFSLGKSPGATGVFVVNGPMALIRARGGSQDVEFAVLGDLARLELGDRRDPASLVEGTSIAVTGSVGQVRFGQAFTAGSALYVGGDLARLDAAGSIVASEVRVAGDVGQMRVNGSIRLDGAIEVRGDLGQLQVRKSASDLTLDVDGTLGRATFFTDLRDATVTAGAIDQLMVRDDLDSTRIAVTDDLGSLQADDCRSLRLRVSGRLGKVQIKRDLDDAILSALNGIGQVSVRQDVYSSLILAGIEIGSDWALDTAPGGDDAEWGDVRIESVNIGGDMIDTSISAGVTSVNGFYGDGDDLPSNSDTGTSRIERLVVRGQVGSSNLPGESYAITASDGIDSIRIGRGEFVGVPGVVLQEF